MYTHTPRFDVVEAHYAQIFSLLITFFFGVEAWQYMVSSFVSLEVQEPLLQSVLI